MASWTDIGRSMGVTKYLRLGDNHVGTEHVLLALLDLEDGDGPLSAAGLDKAATEAAVAVDQRDR